MWAALIPAIASLAGGAMSYFGGQNSNNANSAMAQQQMSFQQAQSVEQEQFTREMWQRQADFNSDEAAKSFGRNVDSMWASQDFARENRNFQADYVSQSIAKQEQFQREMAQQAQDFSLQSSATAWQRATADMKAAGINPMLAYQRGGASSPIGVGGSGASGSVASPAVGGATSPAASVSGASRGAQSGAMARIENILGPAVASAGQAGRVIADINQIGAQTDQTRALTRLADEQQHQVRASTGLAIAQEGTERERRLLTNRMAETELRRPGAVSAATARDHAGAAQANMQTALAEPIAGAQIARDRATAGAQQAQEGQTRQGTEATRTYGRSPYNPIEPISQVLQSIWESLRGNTSR